MSIPETVFWCAEAVPAGLALGIYIAALFGIDLTEMFGGRK